MGNGKQGIKSIKIWENSLKFFSANFLKNESYNNHNLLYNELHISFLIGLSVPTSTLIILDIIKTSSKNCLLVTSSVVTSPAFSLNMAGFNSNGSAYIDPGSSRFHCNAKKIHTY